MRFVMDKSIGHICRTTIVWIICTIYEESKFTDNIENAMFGMIRRITKLRKEKQEERKESIIP